MTSLPGEPCSKHELALPAVPPACPGLNATSLSSSCGVEVRATGALSAASHTYRSAVPSTRYWLYRAFTTRAGACRKTIAVPSGVQRGSAATAADVDGGA